MFSFIRSLPAAFIIITVLSSHAQQQFIHTASKSNNSCNGDCSIMDVAQLNNNPEAIIWVTPVIEKGLNLNPHPIGVYYFQDQWRIMNLDSRPIPPDAKFKVEYVATADEIHFQYSITPENIRKDGSAIIDHPALNNNPTVKFSSIASWNPQLNRAITNRDSITIQFNTATGKWHISNINKKPLFARVTYNMMISGKGATINNAVQVPELTIAPAGNSTTGEVMQMYMTIWSNGVKLPGENIVTGHLDQIEILDFTMSASLLSSTSQVGRPGKKIYEPVTIKKNTGLNPTVQLLHAFINNEVITATIDIYSVSSGTSSTGQMGLNYSIKLTGARIVGFKQIKELEPVGQNHERYCDEIKITFTRIEYIKGNVIAVDDHEPR
jgi:type VI secretion system Hcp family effector